MLSNLAFQQTKCTKDYSWHSTLWEHTSKYVKNICKYFYNFFFVIINEPVTPPKIKKFGFTNNWWIKPHDTILSNDLFKGKVHNLCTLLNCGPTSIKSHQMCANTKFRHLLPSSLPLSLLLILFTKKFYGHDV
jgi:hypothetical protein